MSIKNAYTSQPLDRMIAEIQKTLVEHKAQKIMFDYSDTGKIIGLTFGLEIDGNMIGFKLPAKIKEAEEILKEQNLYSDSKIDHALRVAWANIRDWVSSQMAMIDLGQVKIEQVFLPYMVSGDKTLYEIMKTNNFALPSGD